MPEAPVHHVHPLGVGDVVPTGEQHTCGFHRVPRQTHRTYKNVGRAARDRRERRNLRPGTEREQSVHDLVDGSVAAQHDEK